MEIYEKTCHCVTAAHEALRAAMIELRHDAADTMLKLTSIQIKAVGITNQRETLLAWNAKTGKPYSNAIVWDDTRTTRTAREIAHEAVAHPSFHTHGHGHGHHRGAGGGAAVKAKSSDVLRAKTGLPLASYFSGTKLRWMLEHVPELRADLLSDTGTDGDSRDNVKFGTIDSWLVYNMTGSTNGDDDGEDVGEDNEDDANLLFNTGGIHVTDVTNASRWLLMDLETLQWDKELLEIVGGKENPSVPLSALPSIQR
jgi:glycerol kinase